MTLDTETLHRLVSKSFNDLYDGNPAMWDQMVAAARTYSQTIVAPGEPVRIGDVILVVQSAIRINPTFEAHVSSKKIPQKYWVKMFAEYIADRVYKQSVV